MTRAVAARAGGGLAAVALIVACAGCSTSDDAAPVGQDDRHLGIEGPWAAEFEEAAASGVGDAEAAILADGEVTPVELEQAHDGMRRCLADSGLTIDYAADGGFELGSRDGRPTSDSFARSDAALRACESEHDQYVTFLFEQTRRNPEKRDEATLVAACLVDAGVVGEGYGREDYEAESDSGAWSFGPDSTEGKQCLLDSLGLWRQP